LDELKAVLDTNLFSQKIMNLKLLQGQPKPKCE